MVFLETVFGHPCTDDDSSIPPIWWGSLLSKKINKEIILRSSGGQSITQTVIKLNDWYWNIKPNDTVMIAYTTPYRIYFDNVSVSFTDGGNPSSP